MTKEKNVKPWDAYFTWGEIAKKLSLSKGVIYELYNQWKLRYIFKKVLWHWSLCDLIHFNLDDVRENIKMDWF